MIRWEYRFVDLFHRPEYLEKEPPLVRATHLVADDLHAAGLEGWEAVGEVTIAAGGSNHAVILMKRPLADGAPAAGPSAQGPNGEDGS